MKAMLRAWCGVAVAGVALAVTGSSHALAHHAMDGEMPRTLVQGLLSGLGHPMIGPDHLAFIVAIGIVAAMAESGLGLIAAFIASSLAGAAAHVAGTNVPGSELLVAASLLAAGVMIWAGRARASWIWTNLAIAAGLAHGYAYGESIVGAEPTPLGAYLAGLAIVQCAIAGAAYLTARRFDATPGFKEAWLPRAGAVLTLMGTAMLLLAMPFS